MRTKQQIQDKIDASDCEIEKRVLKRCLQLALNEKLIKNEYQWTLAIFKSDCSNLSDTHQEKIEIRKATWEWILFN